MSKKFKVYTFFSTLCDLSYGVQVILPKYVYSLVKFYHFMFKLKRNLPQYV